MNSPFITTSAVASNHKAVRDNVTDFPFKCLTLVGQNVYQNNIYATFLIILIMSIGLILSLMELFFHNEGPKTWAGTFEVATVAFQVF